MSNEDDRRNEAIRRAAEKVTKELADRGQVVEGGWRAYLIVNNLKWGPHLEHDRKLYFLGAEHVFSSIVNFLEPGMQETPNDLKRMQKLYEEIEAFKKTLRN